MKNKALILITFLFAFSSCEQKNATTAVTSGVTDAALANANNDSKSWLTHGLNYNENRFSQLNQINATNVKDLALEWSFENNSIATMTASALPDRVVVLPDSLSLCRIS